MLFSPLLDQLYSTDSLEDLTWQADGQPDVASVLLPGASVRERGETYTLVELAPRSPGDEPLAVCVK